MNHAIICLDATGSMRGQVTRVISSLNEYVYQLPEDTHITVFQFDDARWITSFDGYRQEWKDLTEEDYKPLGMTNLFDSIARTIRHADYLAGDGNKVFIMIDTDGQENSSRQETLQSVKTLVDQKKKAGWEFWFMAYGLDQFAANSVGQTGHAFGMNVASNVYHDRAHVNLLQSGRTITYFAKEDAT